MNLSWLMPEQHGIPVLMYHKVQPGGADELTIDPVRLREQWKLLKSNGYHAVALPDYLQIISQRKKTHPKYVLLTFDDGYWDNLEHVYPLLLEMGWCATFFIVGNTLNNQGQGYENEGNSKKMSLDQLRSLDPTVVQLAVHGYDHLNFGKLDIAGIIAETDKACLAFEESGLVYHPVWAYAYGARPKDTSVLAAMKQYLLEKGIAAAFRIGNRVSTIPAKDVFEICRIDIRGTDTMADFELKLRKGKLKPF